MATSSYFCVWCGNNAEHTCSRCYKKCCNICSDDVIAAIEVIGRLIIRERRCRNCIQKWQNENTIPANKTKPKTKPVAQTNAAKSGANQDQDLCKLHRKVCKLFCWNCSVAICGVCMIDGEQHDQHQINNLTIVHQEKLSKVESKLVRAEKCNDELRKGFAAYERNLQLLEREEALVQREIEAIAKASGTEVASMTNIRKRILGEKLDLPKHNGAVLADLRSKIEQLTTNEFVQQFPEIDRECDGLIGAPEAMALQSVNDIECRLIPPYQFQQVTYQKFLNAEIHESQVFTLKSAHDAEWKLAVFKSDMVQIKLIPSDPHLSAFRHVLNLVIPHPEYTKQVHQSFELNGPGDNAFDLAVADFIVDQGFCSDSGDLVMKIGIRPLNVIIEKQLLAYQYEQQKASIEKVTRQLESLTGRYDHNHLVMHFKPKLSELQKGEDLRSFQIRDDENRQWRLIVRKKPNSKSVEVYVDLYKGFDTRCNFFVEMRHKDPTKTIVQVKQCECFHDYMWGWTTFITWDELKSDTGFYPDGNLHFRFGVRPLLPTFAAANA